MKIGFGNSFSPDLERELVGIVLNIEIIVTLILSLEVSLVLILASTLYVPVWILSVSVSKPDRRKTETSLEVKPLFGTFESSHSVGFGFEISKDIASILDNSL